MQNQYMHIDLSYLQDFSQGDEKFMKELISTSVAQTDAEVAWLKDALKTSDFERIARICHKLRSSMGFMGVSAELIGKLKYIETLGSTDPEILKTQTEEVIETCNNINRELKEELRKRND